MAFVNTRDTIGDQATVDGLVEHSLIELKEDGISVLPQYSLYGNDGLQVLDLPSITRIDDGAIAGCTNLNYMKLGGNAGSLNVHSSAFAIGENNHLKHLILDYPILVSASSYGILNAGPISAGEGAIYVPEELLQSYKSSRWKTYYIARIDDYPLESFDTITDSWSTILSNSSYSTAYNINDSKVMELTDGTKIKMDLAAIDTDVKSDNTGTAKLTWICHASYYNSVFDYNDNAWGNSYIRTWLIDNILSKIPTEIKSHIVSVKKSYRSKSPNDETLWSDDEIWIPSYRELRFTDTTYVESDGVIYSSYFPSVTNSINDGLRMRTSVINSTYTAAYWFLRSQYDSYRISSIAKPGSFGNARADKQSSVIFGFCTD